MTVAATTMLRAAQGLPQALRAAVRGGRVETVLLCLDAGDIEVLVPWLSGSVERLRQEVQLSEALAARMPVPCARYRESGETWAARPRSPGQTPRPDDAVPAATRAALARVIAWLHELPPDDALDAGMRVRSVSHQNFARLLRDSARLYADHRELLDERARARTDAFFARGELPAPALKSPRVVHGHLGVGTVRVAAATGELVQVTGWGSLALGDPAVSLHKLHQWGGPELVAEVAGELGAADGELARRAAFLARCAALHELELARRSADAEAAEQAIRALRWA